MSRTGDHVLAALVVTLWPGAAKDPHPTVARTRVLKAGLPRLYRWLFTWTLFLLALSPTVLVGRPVLFHHLSQDRRDRCLGHWAKTPFVYPRALWMLVRAVLALARYDGPSADRAVGWTPELSGYPAPGGHHA